MANIRVDVDYMIHDGCEIKFRSPVDCSAVTGLIVYYPNLDGSTISKVFTFTDAGGHDVGNINSLFTSDVVVKVILDVTNEKAFVQNANTNAYLEAQLANKVPAGYGGYGEVITPRYAGDDGKGLADESALEVKLNEIYADMGDRESRRFVFVVKKLGDVTIGSWGWIASIYKSSSGYAIVEAMSGFSNQVSKITKALNGGTWQPAEWVNPPLAVGVEYRTTEKFNGEPVYAKAIYFGEGASGAKSVEITPDSIGGLVRVEGSWCHEDNSTIQLPFDDPFFVDGISVYYINEASVLLVEMYNDTDESVPTHYIGYPVVYYIKTVNVED